MPTTKGQCRRVRPATGSSRFRRASRFRLNPAELEELRDIARNFPDPTIQYPTQDEIADVFQMRTGRCLSRQRVGELLKDIVKSAWMKPPLDDAAVADRQRFANMVFANPELFDDLCFSDEKYFTISQHTRGRRIYCTGKDDARRFREKDPHCVQVMVWGLMSARHGGIALVSFATGVTMTSDRYAGLLYDYAARLPELDDQLMFQQDGSGAHSGPAVTLALRAINHLEFWPPYSPDWSPIEYVWGAMAQAIRAKHPQTRQELLYEIREAWARETSTVGHDGKPKAHRYYRRALENISISATRGFSNKYRENRTAV